MGGGGRGSKNPNICKIGGEEVIIKFVKYLWEKWQKTAQIMHENEESTYARSLGDQEAFSECYRGGGKKCKMTPYN